MHRDRSHDQSQAHAEQMPPEAVLKHALICPDAPVLVETQAALDDMIAHVVAEGVLSYDSEFISELSYFPKLCLIQAATAKRLFVVDALAELDLQPFWELLVNPAIEKIVHAGLQDLEPAVRHTGKAPVNVFDVQLAAGFIYLPYPLSLGKLMRELLGINLGKGLAFTHWDARPLSQVHLRYAADDVRYLVAAREALRQRLEQAGNLAWAQEECRSLCEIEHYQPQPNQRYQRVQGSVSLSGRSLTVLRELAALRDLAAREQDLPPRSLLKDEVLISLAKHPARTVADLDQVRGLPRPVEDQYGPAIVEATLRALEAKGADWPEAGETPDSPHEKIQVDALYALACALCLGRSVDPPLAFTRPEIGRFYLRGRGQTDQDCRLMRSWRGELLGKPLQLLLSGKATLRASWPEGRLRSTLDETETKGQ